MATLNTLITLRRPASGEDAAGQPTAGWEAVASVWADPLSLSGRQAIQADAKRSAVSISYRIHRRADVAAGWSLLDGAEAFEVKAVLHDRRSRMWTDLVCEAVA